MTTSAGSPLVSIVTVISPSRMTPALPIAVVEEWNRWNPLASAPLPSKAALSSMSDPRLEELAGKEEEDHLSFPIGRRPTPARHG